MASYTPHVPVLLGEVVKALGPHAGGRYIDGTLGNGGHAAAILEASAPDGRLLGLDADPQALQIAAEGLAPFAGRFVLVNANFVEVGRAARDEGFAPADGILLDLGWSSTQIGEPARGFSFMHDGPLDMRFDPRQETTAADLLNDLPEAELADLIWRYGEERYSRRIARVIVRNRPLHRTRELAELLERTVGRREKIHPATRVFQALRIAVNDELRVLEETLEQLPDLLAAGGVMAIITFHSLEDRIVKRFLQRESSACICPPEAPACVCGHRPTLEWRPRKPIVPADDEVAANPGRAAPSYGWRAGSRKRCCRSAGGPKQIR